MSDSSRAKLNFTIINPAIILLNSSSPFLTLTLILSIIPTLYQQLPLQPLNHTIKFHFSRVTPEMNTLAFVQTYLEILKISAPIYKAAAFTASPFGSILLILGYLLLSLAMVTLWRSKEGKARILLVTSSFMLIELIRAHLFMKWDRNYTLGFVLSWSFFLCFSYFYNAMEYLYFSGVWCKILISLFAFLRIQTFYTFLNALQAGDSAQLMKSLVQIGIIGLLYLAVIALGFLFVYHRQRMLPLYKRIFASSIALYALTDCANYYHEVNGKIGIFLSLLAVAVSVAVAYVDLQQEKAIKQKVQ